jgi:hypothetical protein
MAAPRRSVRPGQLDAAVLRAALRELQVVGVPFATVRVAVQLDVDFLPVQERGGHVVEDRQGGRRQLHAVVLEVDPLEDQGLLPLLEDGRRRVGRAPGGKWVRVDGFGVEGEGEVAFQYGTLPRIRSFEFLSPSSSTRFGALRSSGARQLLFLRRWLTDRAFAIVITSQVKRKT